MIKEIIIGILIIHGMIHLLGFAKGFNIAELDQFSESISKPYGVVWFIASILFLSSGIGFLLDQAWWVYMAIISVLLSQSLIVRFWLDAKIGTTINFILVIAILIFFNIQ